MLIGLYKYECFNHAPNTSTVMERVLSLFFLNIEELWQLLMGRKKKCRQWFWGWESRSAKYLWLLKEFLPDSSSSMLWLFNQLTRLKFAEPITTAVNMTSCELETLCPHMQTLWDCCDVSGSIFLVYLDIHSYSVLSDFLHIESSCYGPCHNVGYVCP